MRVQSNGILDFIFLAFAWGLSFLVLLKTIHAFGWAGSVSFRALAAGGTLMIIVLAKRRRLDFSAGRWSFAVVGATTIAGNLTGMSLATPRIGTAMMSIFAASIPLFSMLISQLWGLERITNARLAGLFLGLLGIVLLVGFPAVPVTSTFMLGCACALMTAVSAAFGSNYISRYASDVGSLELAAGSSLFGGIVTLPLLLVVPVPALPGPIDFGYLLLLGSIMSAMTYIAYFRLVASIGATNANTVEFAVPVVAVTTSALFLHEPLSAIQIIGAVVIVCGCALVLGLKSSKQQAFFRPNNHANPVQLSPAVPSLPDGK